MRARVARRLGAEMARFGTVGALGFVTDTVLFNLVHAGLGVGSVPAKAASVSAATLVAFLGNRQWTYRSARGGDGAGRQFAVFCLVSAVGGAIQVGAVWVSHDVLGFSGLFADNVAGSGVGMALATVFRFWGYRTLVFSERGRFRPREPLGGREPAAHAAVPGQVLVSPTRDGGAAVSEAS